MPIVDGISKKEEDTWVSYDELFLQSSNNEDISLITSIGHDRLTRDTIKGFCHLRFRANFILDEIKLEKVEPNSLLSMGNVILQVTKIGKKCHQGCPALTSPNPCTLNQHIFFAKVIKEGTVKKGDQVEIRVH